MWFQVIGVHDQAEKDEIVKSVMHLKNAEIEEGYTKDAALSRQVRILSSLSIDSFPSHALPFYLRSTFLLSNKRFLTFVLLVCHLFLRMF